MEVKEFRSHLKSSNCGCLALMQKKKTDVNNFTFGFVTCC